MDIDYQKIKERKEELRRLKQFTEEEAAKRRLSKDVEKHLRTIMIAALAEFEEEFGVYWGIGKDDNQLDPDEQEDRERWKKVRTNILNKGNNKIRASMDEISKYTISPPEYKVEFNLDNKEKKEK